MYIGWGWLPPRRPSINPFKEDSLDSLRGSSSNSIHIDPPADESSSSSDGSFEIINSVSSSADQYSLEEVNYQKTHKVKSTPLTLFGYF